MTEKRFYKDRGTFWDNDKRLSMNETVELLNHLHEENIKCKEYNATIYANSMKNDREHLKQISQLKKENEHLKQLIKEAYETERTQLGKSVLKQLIEQIE